MCRNCGSIIGGGQKQCAVCGASVSSNVPSAQAPRPVVDREAMRFARAVLDRPYKFTVLLLIANVFLFLLMWQSSGMSLSVLNLLPDYVLVAYGAKVNFLVREHHQWWRLVTPMFLHVNLLHLLVNMYSLWIVGPYVEKLYGSAKLVVFWVVTGIAALIASYLTVVSSNTAVGPLAGFILKNHDAPSAGASGALFGLVGVLFVFGIKFRRELPEGFKRAFGTGLLPMIMLNLFIGYVGRGIIDNAAHLGGLVAGAAFALVVDYRRPGEKSGMAMTWQILQVAAIALVAISFLKTVQHFRDPVTGLSNSSVEAQLSDQTGKFFSFVKAMNEAQEGFYLILKNDDVSAVDKTVQTLEAAPSLDPESEDLKATLKSLVLEAKAINSGNATGAKPDEKLAQQKQNELANEFVAWSKQYNAWLKNNGRKYGGLIEVTESPLPDR